MFKILKPNTSSFIEAVENLSNIYIGSSVSFLDKQTSIEDFDFCIISINECRGDQSDKNEIDFEEIKIQLYQLYKGNWNLSIIDLGILDAGESISDTYYAFQSIIKKVLGYNIIPIILGGSQDILYSQYRAYDGIKYMLNLANIDAKFDLGDSNVKMHNQSFLSHMIVQKPYNLFNYANVGYQTYLNSQEEINLLEKMFFEAYRLGEVSKNIESVEPTLRDADIVALDVTSIQSQSLGQDSLYPNGFDSREICALSRYAGISDKVSSFGLYELQHLTSNISKQLIAQVIWYFIEGVKFRLDEKADINNPNFIKYQVPVENDILVFYESQLSGRWWIEISSNFKDVNNKLNQHTLLPCDKQNYISACNQNIPERWVKARKKNEF
ncbi:formimidoylglutamase [Flavobacterium sp. CS20]|uniref:formimidoylglutamase n=1 Tax=Flavobacterium sp. CS20 TaxID=2775246 RepID=UPI001B3A2328|nr:formimidoylglutamase [Flavobacterium sp. CS20]QTY28123.1 formimidoylglutamase [Flavobacterium sp. CS20]